MPSAILECPKPSSAAISQLGKTLVARQLIGCGHRLMKNVPGHGRSFAIELQGRPYSVLVRSNLAPKPSGGSGKLALDWWFPQTLSADLLALADISANRVWLLTREDALRYAQQDGSASGKVHLYMHLDSVETRAGHERTHEEHFREFLLAPEAP